MIQKYYKQFDVYKKTADHLDVYRCFKDLETGLFYVQSMDTFYYPLNKTRVIESNLQLMELFLDDEPNQREKGQKTVNDAIDLFNKQFDD